MIRIFLLVLVFVGAIAVWSLHARHPGNIVEDYEKYPVGSMPSTWTPEISKWSIVQLPGHGKEIYQPTTRNDSKASYGSSAWADYSVQCVVCPDSNAKDTGVTLLGRLQDFRHFYQFELRDGTQWTLCKDNADTWTTLGQGAFDYKAGVYYVLKLEMKGRDITASISSDHGATFVTLCTGTDSSYSAGKIGLRSWGTTARFDDIKITDL